MVLLLGCNKTTTLEDFGRELAFKSHPGKYTHNFIGDSISLAPDQYLIYCYQKLSSKWEFVPDPHGEDQIRSSEEISKNNLFKGDCEDYAVMIMSFCRMKNIDAVFCLGKNLTNNTQGHIWVEVPICSSKEYTLELRNRIDKYLNSNLITIVRNDTIWLSFIPLNVINNYKLEYVVDIQGKLRVVYSSPNQKN